LVFAVDLPAPYLDEKLSDWRGLRANMVQSQCSDFLNKGCCADEKAEQWSRRTLATARWPALTLVPLQASNWTWNLDNAMLVFLEVEDNVNHISKIVERVGWWPQVWCCGIQASTLRLHLHGRGILSLCTGGLASYRHFGYMAQVTSSLGRDAFLERHAAKRTLEATRCHMITCKHFCGT
jgi:hypothetical protein